MKKKASRTSQEDMLNDLKVAEDFHRIKQGRGNTLHTEVNEPWSIRIVLALGAAGTSLPNPSPSFDAPRGMI